MPGTLRDVPQGRRVRRVVRKVDSWTVLRVAFLFCLSMFAVAMVAGILIWSAASRLGVFDDITKFMTSIGFERFTFHGDVILRVSALGGLVLVVIGTAGSLVGAILYNLISDIVGGIEFVMLEEDVVRSVPAPAPVALPIAAVPTPLPTGEPLPVGLGEGNGAVAASRVTSIRSGL